MPKARRCVDRRFQFERLENRSLLAGNVTAALSSGVLTLTGDASSNSVQVSQISSTTWKVLGIATTINGSRSAQTFNGVTDIGANLGTANDSIKVSQMALTGNLTIDDSAGGSQFVQLLDVSANQISVTTGAGTDRVNVTDASTAGDFSISTGDGRDSAIVSDVQSGGRLFLYTFATDNDGADFVKVTDVSSTD